MPKFVHSPLHDPRRQIRLLRFSAESDPVNIRCSLSTHGLYDAPEFVALSYECGSPDTTVDIIVESRSYTIRHNLSLLLSHIQRRPHCLDAIADGFLWVDAICISQTDIDEKNAQVAMMGAIYQAAARTYAWLGWPDRYDARPVYDFMMDAASAANQASISKYCDALRSKAMSRGTCSIDSLPQVLEWCCSSYFQRRWVVQELCLSKMVILVCGELAIRLPLIKPLMRVIKALSYHYEHANEYARSITSTLPYRMVEFLDQYAHKPLRELNQRNERYSTSSLSGEPNFLAPKTSLHAVLEAFQDTQCERVHDGLYAILSLVEGGGGITVNYLLRPEGLLGQVLSHKRWNDVASVKATMSVLGLTYQKLWPGSYVDSVETDLKGNMDNRALLPAQEVTCRGRIQTIFEIPVWAPNTCIYGFPQTELTYEGSTLSPETFEIVEKFFDAVDSRNYGSWTSRDYVPLNIKATEQASVLFVSDYGYAGVSKNVKLGDVVCVMHTACDVTFVLREQEKHHFRLIGTAASLDCGLRTGDLLEKNISTAAPAAELVSPPLTATERESYEEFASKHDLLRRFCAAKAHASSCGRTERYAETLDIQVDMWDWVQYACSDFLGSDMGSMDSNLLKLELRSKERSVPIDIPSGTEYETLKLFS